jgi:NDP-sugar pyrophosphorylase family protein
VKAAILAAGKGERLVRAGITIDKPLIRIGGQPLIARAIEAAASAGASAAACIVNDLSPALYHYLTSTTWPLPTKVVKKTTDNSLESLTCLAPYLRGEPFLLFTVDAVFRPSALARFLTGARCLGNSALGLTRFVDDEKPLYVDIGPDHAVRSVGGDAEASPYVTAGFYYFEPDVLDYLAQAHALGLNSLRLFFRFICEEGYPLSGVRVSKVIDVDHPEDIEAAEYYVMGRPG